MKHFRLILFILCGALLGAAVACGGATPATTTTPAADPTEAAEVAQPETETVSETDSAQSAVPGCEEYLRFCVVAEASGTETAVATTGTNHYAVSNCAEWAAAGEARILELPFITAAGENQLTIALTRIGEYTGPGNYALTALSTTGMGDMFPAISLNGRAFSNGEDTTATVTIAADGSGSLQATNLVEIASVQVSNPDPAARVDLSMQWTCKDIN